MEFTVPFPGHRHPATWVLVFCRRGDGLARFLPGKYKHVRAYGYLPDMKLWVLVDPACSGLSIAVVPDDYRAVLQLAQFTWKSDLVRIKHQGARRFFPLAFTCVGAVKHLIGLNSGALLLSTLHRHCLRSGGRVLEEATDEGTVRLQRAASDLRSAAG